MRASTQSLRATTARSACRRSPVSASPCERAFPPLPEDAGVEECPVLLVELHLADDHLDAAHPLVRLALQGSKTRARGTIAPAAR